MLANARWARVGGLKEESRTDMWRAGEVKVPWGNGHRGCDVCTNSTVDSPFWMRWRRELKLIAFGFLREVGWLNRNLEERTDVREVRTRLSLLQGKNNPLIGHCSRDLEGPPEQRVDACEQRWSEALSAYEIR